MIHTTIGVYANGDMKFNGVPEQNLEAHIEYNLIARPGRGFFVDGECKNQGYLTDDEVVGYTKLFKDDKYKQTKDTQPYV